MNRKIRSIVGIILGISISGWIVLLFWDKNQRNLSHSLPEIEKKNKNTPPPDPNTNTPEAQEKEIPKQEQQAILSVIEDTTIRKTPNILIPVDISPSRKSPPLIIAPTTEKKTTTIKVSSLEEKIKEYEQKEYTREKNTSLHVTQNHDNKKEQNLRKRHIQNLESLYKEKKNNADLKKLIQELVKNYEFKDAWNYIQNMTNLSLIDSDLYIYTYFNIIDIDSEQDIKHFRNKLNNFKNNGKISGDTMNFYQGLLALSKKDYDKANEVWANIQQKKYITIIRSILDIEKQIETKRDVPMYYQDALIALEMLKSGYFSLAKYLAMESLMKNEKYILPYQVLAYNAFLSNNLADAINYFQKLTKIDPAKHNSYKYMMAVSYYRSKDYSNAILHLSQIQNIREFKNDVLRYLLLSYKNIEDYTRMLDLYEKLIDIKDLISGDFVEFFENIFIIPYENTGKINLTSKELSLAKKYIQRCHSFKKTQKTQNSQEQENQENICLLGDIGIRVANKQRDAETLNVLKSLLSVYNQNFTLQLLGDYYRYTNQYPYANEYYLKATLTTKNEEQKKIIQEKLLLLRDDNISI